MNGSLTDSKIRAAFIKCREEIVFARGFGRDRIFAL
jgi:hypothetical protein